MKLRFCFVGALATGVILALTAGRGNTADRPLAAATEIHPESAFGGYLAALHAQQNHDYGAAGAFIDAALAADPDNYNLIRRAFALRVSEGHIAQAMPLARKIAAHDGTAGLAGLVLIEQAIKAGHFDTAVKVATAVPHEGAQRYAAPLLVAWANAGRGDIKQAMRDLDTMGDTSGLGPLKLLHQALIADFAGEKATTAAAYKKLLTAETPPTTRIAQLAGNFYERQHDGAAARAVYESVAPVDDSDVAVAGLDRLARQIVPPRPIATAADGAAEALFDLASLLNQADTLDAALVYARLAIDLRPNFALAELLAGEIREQQGQPKDALALYRRIERGSLYAWTARMRIALTLDALSQTDESAKLLESLAAEQPQRPAPLIELGDILRSHSRFADAVKAYDRALARVPKPTADDWRLFYSRGVCYERIGQWPRAQADLERALKLRPNQPLVLNYLGYTWIDKGEKLPEAVKMIERAVALQPNDGYIVDSLGWAYFHLGQYARATETLERANELVPDDPTINDHLGDAYWRTGRETEARYQWRRALQFKPDADEAKTIQAKLDHGLGAAPAKVSGG
ncbi:MAG: tetratricopeptide repeat protein [Alphaproteobacteria bacterium]|jgi:tetratricopeptide (TPR) repeat protein|nr:tetratricopeptide repeat protein [Alphaproteobacteria bacterium]